MKTKPEEKVTQDDQETFWKYHISQANRSGLTKGRYCREKRLNYRRFYYWYRKIVNVPIRGEKKSLVKKEKKGTSCFVPIKLNESLLRNPILCELELAGGHKIIVYDKGILDSLFPLFESRER